MTNQATSQRAFRICVVTSSRADFGFLSELLRLLEKDPGFELQLIATGSHLSSEFGSTYRDIEAQGFTIADKIDLQLNTQTPLNICHVMSRSIAGFAESFKRLCPDLVILPGDRYEMLGPAQAALIFRIPVAHIGGGDVTQGAFDESIRHALTKLAQVHFPTHQEAANRICQMGENPDLVFNVGSLSLDLILKVPRLSRSELEANLDFKFKSQNLLITFHPATLEEMPESQQIETLLEALGDLSPEIGLIFTHANADTGGNAFNAKIDQFAANRPNSWAFSSLGSQKYYSLIAAVDAVVGNSSSGLYEVPSFKKPTVNIGNRQKGRKRAKSVIDCELESKAITDAIHKAFVLNCDDAVNPFGDGQSAPRVLETLRRLLLKGIPVQKVFFDQPSLR